MALLLPPRRDIVADLYNNDYAFPDQSWGEFSINFSQINYSEFAKLWIKLDDHVIALKSLAVLPIIILGLFGNAAIIAVVIRVSVMRTCTNLFICNMAIADLMTIVFCSWTIIIVDGFENFILGKLYCRLDGFLHLTCLLSSVFSLVVISGDRLLGIVFPFSRRLSQQKAIVIMVAIWVAAMTCGSPLFIWRWLQVRQWKDYTEIWCNENVNILKYYWLIILTLLIYVPLIVMAVAYTVIIMQLDKYEHQLFLRDHPLKMKYRKKVIKVLFMYVLNFLLFWIVFQVVVFYRYMKLNSMKQTELPGWYTTVFFVGHVLTYAQSAINPIIYGACNESFRKAFRITFKVFFKKNRVRPALNNMNLQSPARPQQRENNESLPKTPNFAKTANQNGHIIAPSTQETELKPLSAELVKREGIIPPPNTPAPRNTAWGEIKMDTRPKYR